MSKEDQRILVVERDLLFGNDCFQGFKACAGIDYEGRILTNLKIMRRGDAENDPTHKQPIGYTIVANPSIGKVFAYQRSVKDKEYGEKRLQGKWSWGFGGHIEASERYNENPISDSMFREVTQEELEIIGNIQKPKVIGYINDESNSVGTVHFGILYLIETDAQKVNPKDPEIARVELMSVGELEKLCSTPSVEVENWSRIALEPLRKLL
jgi:predicted NUDIX family phosphoesterase